jgi:hypothetical protein
MFFKNIYTGIISGIFLSLSFNSFCQEIKPMTGPLVDLNKINTLQIISYKPKKAKAGKDGSERITVIKLFNGPKNGKDGKDGIAGPNLRVEISSIKIGDTNILRMIVSQIAENKRPDSFYVNPRYGQIKLIADGGDGGNGGQGEPGGGSPGNGGKGGTGGNLEIFFDSSSLVYADCVCLVFSNEGGIGGWSGENYGKAGESGTKGLPIYLREQNGKIIFVR